MGERFEVPVGPVTLVGEQWEGDGPAVVLLHAGVADRRVWHDVAPRLDGPVVAYDRRGFGETPASSEPFTHVEDLLAVTDATVDGPAWLVGNSQGGRIALDTALTAPERVAGLVLISPAVSGAPEEGELEPDTARLDAALEAATGLAEVLRLETWLWLDGPAGPEGRVGGAARELALDMNRRILANEGSEGAGGSDVDAWSRLEEIAVPVTVAWGELDVPLLVEQCRTIAQRIPRARSHELAGVAHLPSLERPDEVVALIRAGTSGR
jgi:pimeloyl-ACP methyl ester carboxylesterase